MRKLLNLYKLRKAWIIPGLLVLCLLYFVPEAQAQSIRDLNNRLNRIENEIQTLSRSVYRGEAPPPGAIGDPAIQANAEIKIQQLEMELREIRGTLEQQSYEIRQLRAELERALSDMEMRVGDMEGTGGRIKTTASPTPRYTANTAQPAPAYGSQAPKNQNFTWNSNPTATQPAAGGQLGTLSQSPTTGAVTASVTDRGAAAYENAFALLKNNQYDAAEKGFQSFINSNPNHALVSNAKYWLGETFYVRGQFERAARIFAEGYKSHPQSAKAPDNLLKLGMSLAGLGNKEDACVALGQLEKEYPSGSTPVLRRAQQEKSRLGCV